MLHNIKTTHFSKNHGHGLAQRLYAQMCTGFKGITPNISFVRAQTFSHTESLLRILILYMSIGTVTLINLQDKLTCRMSDVSAKMSAFNLFYIWKF